MTTTAEQRMNQDPGAVRPQCLRCRHYVRGTRTCPAFPDRIPGPIMANEHDHREPYPGDHGIRFEPMTGADA